MNKKKIAGMIGAAVIGIGVGVSSYTAVNAAQTKNVWGELNSSGSVVHYKVERELSYNGRIAFDMQDKTWGWTELRIVPTPNNKTGEGRTGWHHWDVGEYGKKVYRYMKKGTRFTIDGRMKFCGRPLVDKRWGGDLTW